MMALQQLCPATQTFIGAGLMLAVLLAILLCVLSLIYKKKKFLRPLAIFVVLGAVGLSILYLLAPIAINILMGAPQPLASGCGSYPVYPPYCGHEYCEQNDYADGENCTCIQY